MPSVYCISQPGREPITDVDSFEAVEGAIRAGGPGCYHMDEISSDSLASGHASRRWDIVLKRLGGTVELPPDRPA